MLPMGLLLKTGNHLTQKCFVTNLVEFDPVVSSLYFLFIIIIYPWKRAWPFTWTSFNSNHQILLRTKLGWNWPNGSVLKRSHRCGRSGFDPGQDRPKSLKQWQLHCQALGNRCEFHMSLDWFTSYRQYFSQVTPEMAIIIGWPVSQKVWHAKETSLINGHECWV